MLSPLFCLLLLASSPKPSVEVWSTSIDGSVRCMRGMGFMHCPGPVVPIIYIKVSNPSADFYCPEITIRVGDSYRDTSEADCAPWEEWKEENATDQFTVAKIVRGRLTEGKWTVVIEVRQGKKSIKRSLEIRVGAVE